MVAYPAHNGAIVQALSGFNVSIRYIIKFVSFCLIFDAIVLINIQSMQVS
jgi:hypothetical protein